MTLSTSLITGRLPLPDDTTAQRTVVRFVLSQIDSESADIVVPAPIQTTLVDGEFAADFALWQNVAGLRGTSYSVTAFVYGADGFGVEHDLGKIQVGTEATYVLADLLEASDIIVPGGSYTVIADSEFATLSEGIVPSGVARLLGSSTLSPYLYFGDGQSNMASHGTGQDTFIDQTGGGIWIYSRIDGGAGGTMVRAEYGVSPLNVKPGGTSTNPAQCYAQIMVHAANVKRASGTIPLERPIWIVVNAVGGVSISEWLDAPYTRMIAMDEAMEEVATIYGAPVAIDHHHRQQAEADSNSGTVTPYSTHETYLAGMASLYAQYQAKSYWTPQTFATHGEVLSSRPAIPDGRTNYACPANDRNRAIRQFVNARSVPNLSLVDCTDLVQEDNTVTNINHFSGAGLQTIGERAARIEIAARLGAIGGAHQVPSGSAYTVHPQIDLTGGEWALGSADLLTGLCYVVANTATGIHLLDRIEKNGNAAVKLSCGVAGSTLYAPVGETIQTHLGLVESCDLPIGTYDIWWANRWIVDAASPLRGDHMKYGVPNINVNKVYGLSKYECRSAVVRVQGNTFIGLPMPDIGMSITFLVNSVTGGAATIGKACHSASVASGGSGYAVGDTIVPDLGAATGYAPTLIVTKVNAGAIVTVDFVNRACVTSSANPTSPAAQVSTSGSGTGATFNLVYSTDGIGGPEISGSSPTYSLTAVRQVVELECPSTTWRVISDNVKVPFKSSGTWTPSISTQTPGTLSVSYSSQVGTWLRMGDMIYLEGEIVFTPTVGTASGAWKINGLPIAPVGGYCDISLRTSTTITFPASRSGLYATTLSGTSLRIRTMNPDVDLPIANITDGVASTIKLSGWYRIS